MNRGVWVDKNSDGRGDLKSKFGITEPYFDATWIAAKTNPRSYLASNPSGLAGHLYICGQGPGWIDASKTAPAVWAKQASDLVQKCAPGTHGSEVKVHLNVELHDPDWLLAMLKQWRRYQPKRWTALVIEGMQGGWFGKVAVAISVLDVPVYAEAFHGQMV